MGNIYGNNLGVRYSAMKLEEGKKHVAPSSKYIRVNINTYTYTHIQSSLHSLHTPCLSESSDLSSLIVCVCSVPSIPKPYPFIFTF